MRDLRLQYDIASLGAVAGGNLATAINPPSRSKKDSELATSSPRQEHCCEDLTTHLCKGESCNRTPSTNMLGKDSFVFQTPNVIDPGESAPGRPSRKGGDGFHNGDDNTAPPGSFGSDDIRARASFLLQQDNGYKPNPRAFGRTKVIFNPSTNPQDDDGEIDPESPVHDQLPSVEQARMFAATILNESERRDSRRNIFSSSPPHSPRRDGEMTPLSSFVRGKHSLDNGRRLRRKHAMCRMLCVTCIVLILTAFALAVVILVHGSGGDHSVGSSGRMKATVAFLSEKGISDADSLTRSESPQHKAAYWLASKDKLRLDIPEISDREYVQFLQRYVLAVLFYALDGDNWKDNLRFLGGHECGWFKPVKEGNEEYAMGVDCYQDSYSLQIKSIYMPSNNVKGSIPSELKWLTELEFVSLKQNDISGSIPSELSALSKLEYLDLTNNHISKTIPEFLGDLTHLKVLGLSRNVFEGPLPSTLSSLTKLLTFAVDNNFLTGDLEAVAGMTNLEYFYAENNSFNSRIDKGILNDLKHLVELDLSGNELKASLIPSELFEMTGLRSIDLSNNKIKGQIPENLKTNEVLGFLSLRRNQVGGKIHSNFGANMRALTHLDLEDNQLTGSISDHFFHNFTGLTHLFLGKNNFDEWSLPASMAQLRSLSELSLDNANVVGTIPSFFASDAFKQLKVVDLRLNGLTGSLPNSDDDKWGELHKLSVLLLNDNKLTGSLPEALTHLSNLEVVSLHHNGFLSEAGGLCRKDGDSLSLLTTDCGKEFTCDCCVSCCDSDDCYSEVHWDGLEFSETPWEQHFQRADYSLNPHILSS